MSGCWFTTVLVLHVILHVAISILMPNNFFQHTVSSKSFVPALVDSRSPLTSWSTSSASPSSMLTSSTSVGSFSGIITSSNEVKLVRRCLFVSGRCFLPPHEPRSSPSLLLDDDKLSVAVRYFPFRVRVGLDFGGRDRVSFKVSLCISRAFCI
jgi:hypothetical protein